MSAPDSRIWVDAAPLLSELQRATEGATLVIKVDNERTDPKVFTVVVAGTKFNGQFFRQDGSDLVDILRKALDFCSIH